MPSPRHSLCRAALIALSIHITARCNRCHGIQHPTSASVPGHYVYCHTGTRVCNHHHQQHHHHHHHCCGAVDNSTPTAPIYGSTMTGEVLINTSAGTGLRDDAQCMSEISGEGRKCVVM